MSSSIVFHEKEHIYEYIGHNPEYKNQPLVSVTTFIGWFKNKYDVEYWSTYKAVKDFITDISNKKWYDFKQSAGGWQNVVDYYRECVNNNRISEKAQREILKIQIQYLQDWKMKKDVSNVKGSGIHKDLEYDFINSKQFEGRKIKYDVRNQDPFYEKQDFKGNACYPECITHNLKYALSGMVDRVDREGIYLDIVDYKTNIKIEQEAFMNQTMHILGLPDCNYYHYLLQMSMYGWMLEQFGYKVRSLTLEHLITSDRYSNKVIDIKTYNMEYRPDMIEKMLEYRFKKELITA